MKHTKHVTRQHPASAETLLQWQQKATIFGSWATGVNTLSNAFNVYTQAQERKQPDA